MKFKTHYFRGIRGTVKVRELNTYPTLIKYKTTNGYGLALCPDSPMLIKGLPEEFIKVYPVYRFSGAEDDEDITLKATNPVWIAKATILSFKER